MVGPESGVKVDPKSPRISGHTWPTMDLILRAFTKPAVVLRLEGFLHMFTIQHQVHPLVMICYSGLGPPRIG